MLASQETSSSAISYNSKFSRHLLSIYICKVLGNLQLNLLSKSKVYEDQALSAIFLHENYNYILKALEKSELIQLVAVTQNTAKRSYQEHIEQQIQTYQCSWLKSFSDGLEELCKIQKTWAVLDTEQRDKIHQTQKNIVKETYRAFLHRFGRVPVTKNPEKYIKYCIKQIKKLFHNKKDWSDGEIMIAPNLRDLEY
ncbi:Exocyst complex component 7 [Camelus dromedarius]|uniref:Exocyst complex component 7 n=1 Tax=Camelus dromedarius TaxID=9838 RepID=A0A5N4D9N3_CAMDR|nr:Exocyst complex component 7 [Camelus dromedarius]